MTAAERLTLIGLLLIGVAAATLLPMLWDRADHTACATRYAQAQTAADTARVDRQRAPIERRSGGQSPSRLSCGELRLMPR
jgi:hypothetical protein